MPDKVRIEWHSSDVDFRSINATLYMNGKGLFLGRAARMTTEDSDAPWLFWISDAVYGLFEAENFRPFLIQEAVPTLKDEKKKIESFIPLEVRSARKRPREKGESWAIINN
jgi:hypothetical protein